MIKSKRMKSILLAVSLTLGLSLFISAIAYAATYTAVSGDSLFKISQRYNTTVKNLMNANGLNHTSLNVGQTINIPELTAATSGTIAITPTADMSTVTVINEPAKATTAATATKPPESTSVVTKSAEVSSAPTINRGLETTRTPANVPTAKTLSTPANVPTTETLSTPVNNPTVNAAYSASDLDLLSRLITAEAQGESYDTKVAVGAVVMNRVKSSSFPNSISEVIYQNINGYYQFTPVVNGWIDKPADSDSIKASKSALNGTDPTNNSLFYYDNKTTNPWMLAKPVSIQIGNMLFAY